MNFFHNSVDTQQAEYHFVPSITYRANGAVGSSCLSHYVDLMTQYYEVLDNVLTQRCSAVNINMNVSFLESKPSLLDENVVQVSARWFDLTNPISSFDHLTI